ADARETSTYRPGGGPAATAKAMTLGPAATATNCVPSNEYVMGEAFQVWLVWNDHSGWPDRASTAISPPPSSATNTSPVAVESVPPHEFAGPRCGSSQAIAPVWTSIARRIRCGSGSAAVFCVPPRYVRPLSHGPWSLLV